MRARKLHASYTRVTRDEEQESIKQIDHVICVEVAENLILLQIRERIYTRVNEEQVFRFAEVSFFLPNFDVSRFILSILAQ